MNRTPGKNGFVSVGLALLLLLLNNPTIKAEGEVIDPAVMVKEINTATASAEVQYLSVVGNRVLFAAYDGRTGSHLWATEIATGGATRLKTIVPNSPMVISRGIGFFAAYDADGYNELWRTDGTAAGTWRMADLNPALAGSAPSGLVDVNGTLFFFATKGNASPVLWKSDGTAAGTTVVTDATGMSPYLVTQANGKLFIVTGFGGTDFQLSVSDGTAAGIGFLKTFPGSGASAPVTLPFSPLLTAVGDRLFFRADDGIHGMELWQSDGTAPGTTLVVDLKAGAPSSLPEALVNFQGMLYFTTAEGLWKSNGAAAGTQLVKPGAWSELVVAGDLLFGVNADGEHGAELWRSDGTSTGTFLVSDIRPGPAASNPGTLTAVKGKLFFAATDDLHGRELWQSDGTAAGTTLVSDIASGLANATPTQLIAAGDRLFFQAYDDQHGLELWRSDGTAAGTMLVADINRKPDGSRPRNFMAVGEQIYFTAQNNQGETHLWRSDSTATGTQRVAEIGPIAYDYNVKMIVINQALYLANNEQHQLWRIDGASGTPLLLHTTREGVIAALAVLNNRLYFLVANLDIQESGLWQSDGDVATTQRVKAVHAGSELIVMEKTLYFGGRIDEVRWGLWQSDGTESGTIPVDGFPNVGTEWLVNVNGTLFFKGSDPIHGNELWKSDGTAAGTGMVKDIFPGANEAGLFSMTPVNDQIFFIARDKYGNWEVWRSDGTASGTFKPKDIHPDDYSPNVGPDWLTPINGKLLFAISDGVTSGAELWITDGTTEGTQLLKDINPGPADSSPNALANVNGIVFFGATDSSGQRLLWRTDGTAAGTQPLQVLAPQPNETNWYHPAFVATATNIFFSADNGVNGPELWKIPLHAGKPLLKIPPLVNAAAGGGGIIPVDYGNLSNTPQGQLTLTAVLDPKLTYLDSSAAVTPTIQSNTLTWQLPTLAPLAVGKFDLRVQAPVAPLGTGYPVTLTLSTVASDGAPVESSSTVEVLIAAHYYLPIIKR